MSSAFYELVREDLGRQLDVDPRAVLLGVKDGRIVAVVRGLSDDGIQEKLGGKAVLSVKCELRGGER